MLALIPSLRAYGSMLTRSQVEADDLLQDTLVRAWSYRGSFTPGTNLKAWMFQILRNEFYRRLQQPRTEQLGDVLPWQLTYAPDQEWRRLYGDVLGKLEMLNAQSREALLLVAAAGFSYEEAAELCHCAVGTVKSRVNRARSQLITLMQLDRDSRGRRRRPGRGADDDARVRLFA